MVEKARAIKAILAPLNIVFVVNDRVDVALAAGANGVHIGPDDMTPEDARHLLGPDAIIGVSIKTVAAAEAVAVGLIDYAGVGGVYATLSKEQKTPPIGIDGFARVAGILRRRAPALPIVGIAGIDAGNAGAVIGAGADGVAVISALSGSRDAGSGGPHPARSRRRYAGEARNVSIAGATPQKRLADGWRFLAAAIKSLKWRQREKRPREFGAAAINAQRQGVQQAAQRTPIALTIAGLGFKRRRRD